MKVFFVGAGPGDPELLTCKAMHLIQRCRCCIYAGSLVSPEVLRLIPEQAARHDSASLSLDEIVTVFREAHAADMDVVRLHSGDPAIYGAIGEQMRALDELGIPYEVVPGVSSFLAAAAALRVELTAPEIAQTIVLTRARGRTPVPEGQELERLAATHATLCVFLSIHSVAELAKGLGRYYGPSCPAAVVYHASWPDQAVIRGTLADIAERVEAARIHKTALLLVGQALSPPAVASKLYDRDFSHGYRRGRQEHEDNRG
jgi:precorrin-4/cobalt-precorrin-4 C11-methyltransferase